MTGRRHPRPIIVSVIFAGPLRLFVLGIPAMGPCSDVFPRWFFFFLLRLPYYICTYTIPYHTIPYHSTEGESPCGCIPHLSGLSVKSASATVRLALALALALASRRVTLRIRTCATFPPSALHQPVPSLVSVLSGPFTLTTASHCVVWCRIVDLSPSSPSSPSSTVFSTHTPLPSDVDPASQHPLPPVRIPPGAGPEC